VGVVGVLIEVGVRDDGLFIADILASLLAVGLLFLELG